MYSGWSPFLRTKFWKKEFVGRGEERSSGEKKVEGSGRTEDSVFGNRNGVDGFLHCCEPTIVVVLGCSTNGGCGNEKGDLGGLLKGLVSKDVNFLVAFLSTMWEIV